VPRGINQKFIPRNVTNIPGINTAAIIVEAVLFAVNEYLNLIYYPKKLVSFTM
jgi:hypothetical protein